MYKKLGNLNFDFDWKLEIACPEPDGFGRNWKFLTERRACGT